MIKEAISFVKEFEANQTESQNYQEDWKGKKFIIINADEENNKLKYKDFEISGCMAQAGSAYGLELD